MRRSALVLHHLVLLAACGAVRAEAPSPRDGPVTERPSDEPSGRHEPVFGVEGPARGSSPRVTPDISTATVVVALPLQPVRDEANATDTRVAAESHGGNYAPWDFRLGWGYEVTRGPISITGVSGPIATSVRAHLHGWADIVGDCHADVVASISTLVSIAPNWYIAAASSPAGITWSRRCHVFLGSTDITPRIEPHVRAAQERIAGRIDETLARQSVAAHAERLWTALHQPVVAGHWTLNLNPEAIGVSSIAADGDVIHASVSATVRPVLSNQAEPLVSVPSMPANAALTPLPTFDVFTDMEVPLDVLEPPALHVVRRAFGALEIASVEVRGGADAVWLGIRASRPRSMIIWAGIVLQYREATRRLECTHASVTDETLLMFRAIGVDAAAVAAALVGVGVPLGPQLDAFSAAYTSAVANELSLGSTMVARVTPGPIRVAAVFNTPDTLGMTLAVPGSITVRPR